MLSVIELAATLVLVGLVWVIQLVHYPAFRFADPGRWSELHAFHTRRVSWLVVPAMLTEAATALALWLSAGTNASPGEGARRAAGVALLAAIWVSTFTVQVPLHNRLARGFDAAAIERLVRSNWVRTLAWTARAALLLWPFAAPAGRGV